MNYLRILNSSIDCVAQFRTSKHPLKNVASDIIKFRKLNSQERKYFLDLVFAWARNSHLIVRFLKQELRFFDGLSLQQRDALALNLLAKPTKDPELFERYNKYLDSLGDERFLIALGEVISEELYASYGANASAIAKGLWSPPAQYLAFDSKVLQREELIAELARLQINATPHDLVPNALKIEGEIRLRYLPKKLASQVWMMDAGSQLVASYIKAKPEEQVLDLCTGEGGKARLIAMSSCKLVALDIDKDRLKKAQKRLSEFKNISFVCADGSKAPLTPNSFDWVLVDAPCSGSGVLRRNPDLIQRLTREDLINYKKLQAALLRSAVNFLKPGAKLIYATCSLFKSENQQQITSLMASNTVLKPVDLDGLKSNCLELFPHIHDCDGFFIAELTKARE